MNKLKIVKEIALKVKDAGGTMFFVGGMIRDKYINPNLKNKDIDTETYGISVETFKHILMSFGEVDVVGESFGVFKIKHLDVDFAMPRTETKVGEFHTSFEVEVDPFIDLKTATSRRDFTINQLMEDVLTGELIDIHGGLADLKQKVIRHIDTKTFQEDPLRIFRAAQFSARFQFQIHPETIALCKTMEVSNISRERVCQEFHKALLKAEKPSVFFHWLKQMNHLHEFFVFTPQMELNLTLLDKAKSLTLRTSYKKEFLFSVLFFHMSMEEVESGLLKVTNERDTIEMVKELNENISVLLAIEHFEKKERRLFLQTIRFLHELLLYGELLGMDRDFLKEIHEDFQTVAKRPLIQGRDLIALGLTPSKQFHTLLTKANKWQCEGCSKEEILQAIQEEL